MSVSAQYLFDRELEVVPVGVGDDADVADHLVAVHRAEQEAAFLLGHRRDLVDFFSGVEREAEVTELLKQVAEAKASVEEYKTRNSMLESQVGVNCIH